MSTRFTLLGSTSSHFLSLCELSLSPASYNRPWISFLQHWTSVTQLNHLYLQKDDAVAVWSWTYHLITVFFSYYFWPQMSHIMWFMPRGDFSHEFDRNSIIHDIEFIRNRSKTYTLRRLLPLNTRCQLLKTTKKSSFSLVLWPHWSFV